MAKTIIYLCSRCGSTYDEDSSEWFTNNYQEQCHICKDFIIGARIDFDVTQKRPQLQLSPIALGINCHICGRLMITSLAKDLHFIGITPVPYETQMLFCPSCLVTTALDFDPTDTTCPSDPDNMEWHGLDIREYVKDVGSDATARARAALRQFNYVQSISGTDMSASQCSRIASLTPESINAIRDGNISIGCGSCKGKMKLAERGGTYLFARNDNGYPIIGLTGDYYLTCDSCSRVDYYCTKPGTDLSVWVFTGDPTKPRKPIAIDDTNLTPQKLEEYKQVRPTTESPAIVVEQEYAGPSADEIQEQLKRALAQQE